MTGGLQQAVGSVLDGPDAHLLHPVVVTVRIGVLVVSLVLDRAPDHTPGRSARATLWLTRSAWW